MNELTDQEICDIAHSTESAEPGRDGYILPVLFARAIIAADRAQPERKPMHEDQIDAAIAAWFANDIVAGARPFAKRMRAALEAFHGIKEKP